MPHILSGFTLVEMIVAVMVIGLLMTVSVVQFQSGRQDDALRSAAIRISDALRTSQSAALSGTLEEYQNASAYGVYVFQKAASKTCASGSTTVAEGLVLFADTDNDALYDNTKDLTIRCISFDTDSTNSVILEEIKETKTDATTANPPSATATFKRPTAGILIDGGTEMKQLAFTLKNTKNNHTKQVVLDRISGRVDFDY